MFKRVFWSSEPYVDIFAHYIPVLQIYGTHLYGKYHEVFLITTIIDGFYHLLHVAFAIVESEILQAGVG